MIHCSDSLEARQHLTHALHHAGLAQRVLACPELAAAIGALEEVLSRLAPDPAPYDDTLEAP